MTVRTMRIEIVYSNSRVCIDNEDELRFNPVSSLTCWLCIDLTTTGTRTVLFMKINYYPPESPTPPQHVRLTEHECDSPLVVLTHMTRYLSLHSSVVRIVTRAKVILAFHFERVSFLSCPTNVFQSNDGNWNFWFHAHLFTYTLSHFRW